MSPHLCNLCRAPAGLMCQRCRDYYCSPDCQIYDWPEHKKTCILMPTLVPITLPRAPLPHQQQQQQHAEPSPPKASKTPAAATVPSSALSSTGSDHNLADKLANLSICSNSSSGLRSVANTGGVLPTTAMPRALKSSTVQEIESAAARAKPQQNGGGSQPPATAGKVKPVAAPVRAVQQQPKPAVVAPVVSTPAASVAAPPQPQQPATSNAGLHKILNRHRMASSMASSAAVPPSKPPPQSAVTSPAVPIVTPTADLATLPPPPVVVAAAPPAPWQQPIELGLGTAQSLSVQHIDQDDPSIVWTIPTAEETVCMQLLAECNSELENNAQHAAKPTIAAGRLVAVPFEGVFYRARVLPDAAGSAAVLNECYVQLIDYGNKLFVPIDQVRAATRAMLERPAFGVPVRLRGHRRRPVAIGEQLVVRLSAPNGGGGVFAAEEEQRSNANSTATAQTASMTSAAAPIVCATVQPSAVAPVAAPTSGAAVVQVEAAAVATPLPPSPPATPAPAPAERRATIHDMVVLPLPSTGDLRLSVLDSSELELGLITAAAFDTERLRHVTQVLTAQIAQHCAPGSGAARPMRSAPQPGDLCLAVFAEDGQWYRALCVEAEPEAPASGGVKVVFVDYGNVTEVTVANLREMPAELVREPCLANSCVIDGVPDRIPFDRIKSYLDTSPVFTARSIREIEKQCYLIEVDV